MLGGRAAHVWSGIVACAFARAICISQTGRKPAPLRGIRAPVCAVCVNGACAKKSEGGGVLPSRSRRHGAERRALRLRDAKSATAHLDRAGLLWSVGLPCHSE